MQRLHECPPSFDLERLAPPEEHREDAASGTRIHAVLALEADAATLSMAELETCDMCNDASMKVIEEWNGAPGMVTPDQTLYERRLGLTAFGKVLDVMPESTADFIFTGQADLILVKGKRGLVIDYKTGRGDTAEAIDNAQLAALAVLVWLRYGVDEIRVAIVQPWAGKPTIADYTENALLLAKGWLLDTINAASMSTPEDVRAGEWCKWCKAKATCPALRTAALQTIEVLDSATVPHGDMQRSALFARAMELSPERLLGAYRGLAMVKMMAAAIEGAFRQRVTDGEMPGWTVETKPGNREVTDVQKAFAALAPLGVTDGDMLEASSVSITALEEAVRKRSGIKSQTPKRITYNLTSQQAKDALNDALNRVGALGRKADKTELVEVHAMERGAE
jgi:RecB family exonuclease